MEYLERPTVLDHYQDQLNSIIYRVVNDVCEFLEDCANIKQALAYDPSPRPPQEFDPLKTIGH
jgi:hypothetical protein